MMLKSILISGVLCSLLSAQSFDDFLQKAIKNSPYLQSHSLSVVQKKQQSKILTRYNNPNLELEYSSFDSKLSSNEHGYRLSYEQPVRLWSVADDKEALAKADIREAELSYIQKKAIFIRELSILYLSYTQAKKLLLLADEELLVAKKIYDISVARFEGGTISNGVKLQAQIDYEMSENAKEHLSLKLMNSYYALMKFVGVYEDINLDENYSFKIIATDTDMKNPNIELYKAQNLQALSEVKVNINSVEWMNVFAELENEPNQDIYRVGLNFPLTFFNNRSEEKTISSIKAKRFGLLAEDENRGLHVEMIRLKKERNTLEKLEKNSKKILKTEIRLLNMYEDGYKIANINLLQLQDIKNRLIETKKSLIYINTALQKNAIYTNYNQGSYSE
jgi:cobalt-zinc-cadmium efflux system outer membrane protein